LPPAAADDTLLSIMTEAGRGQHVDISLHIAWYFQH
jgi:hypothetical protein